MDLRTDSWRMGNFNLTLKINTLENIFIKKSKLRTVSSKYLEVNFHHESYKFLEFM